MAIQTDEVRDLAGFAPEGFLVTSFYLDVDADEFPSPESISTSFDSLHHTADMQLEKIDHTISHDAMQSLRDDIGKIEHYIKGDFKRVDTNGVAIFACTAKDLWHVFDMPTRVQNRVEFTPSPYLAPLAEFLSHTKPTAILLTDRKQARIFTMAEGHVKEWSDFENWVPPRSQAGGWSQMRYQRRSDHWAKHHVDHAADLVFKLEQHYPFDWLILGTDVEAKHDLEEGLHPYVKDRVIGHIHVWIDAPEEQVIEEARKVREEAEEHRIEHLCHQVQEYAGAGGRGTIGLDDTLQALNEQKVHILLLQQGFSKPGSVCPSCGLLLATQPVTCPACGGVPEKVDNVVDAAIQKAFESGSQVEVATQYEELEPIQCIGSIMYY